MMLWAEQSDWCGRPALAKVLFMDFSRRLALASTLLVVPLVVRGQSTVPALTQALPAQTIGVGGTAVNIDLRNYFWLVQKIRDIARN